jgi:hypothetical protein
MDAASHNHPSVFTSVLALRLNKKLRVFKAEADFDSDCSPRPELSVISPRPPVPGHHSQAISPRPELLVGKSSVRRMHGICLYKDKNRLATRSTSHRPVG